MSPAAKQGSYTGLWVINKPAGITSRDVVNRVKKLLGIRRVGHSGTLDPMATGVLIVLSGAATRLVDDLHQFPKTYRAEFQLGLRSDTEDITGDVETIDPNPVMTEDELRRILGQFTGPILQRPPIYSAIQINGQRSYELARAGKQQELPLREVTIHDLQLLASWGDRFRIEVTCSTGTYIRSLGRDIAEALGSSAVMTDLVRTQIGPFTINESLELADVSCELLETMSLSLTQALFQTPLLTLPDMLTQRIQFGQRIPIDQLPQFNPDWGRVGILNSSGELCAIVEYDHIAGLIRPRLVLNE